MPSHSVLDHIRDCALDPSFLGERVGMGAGHTVYKYGENKVIKVPHFRWAKRNLQILTAADAKHNLTSAMEHFQSYMLKTVVHPSSKSSTYCLTQEWLPSFVNLRAKYILEHVEIAKQFSDILKCNQDLIKNKGLSLDFFGQEGCIKTVLSGLRLSYPQMANLVVTQEDKHPHIYIADSQLFEIRKPENAKISRRMMAGASRWGFALNRVFAKGSFGQDIQNKN